MNPGLLSGRSISYMQDKMQLLQTRIFLLLVCELLGEPSSAGADHLSEHFVYNAHTKAGARRSTCAAVCMRKQ